MTTVAPASGRLWRFRGRCCRQPDFPYREGRAGWKPALRTAPLSSNLSKANLSKAGEVEVFDRPAAIRAQAEEMRRLPVEAAGGLPAHVTTPPPGGKRCALDPLPGPPRRSARFRDVRPAR